MKDIKVLTTDTHAFEMSPMRASKSASSISEDSLPGLTSPVKTGNNSKRNSIMNSLNTKIKENDNGML